MPNYCSNWLTLVGKDDEVKRFIDGASSTVNGDEVISILETYYPCPEPLLDHRELAGKDEEELDALRHKNIDEYGHPGWYSWCITNWGTKWSDMDTRVYATDSVAESDGITKALLCFDTAWAPPEAGLEHISSSFPEVFFDLRYRETGMAFEGFVQVKNGECIASECRDIIYTSTDFYEEVDYCYDNLLEFPTW